MKAPVGGSHKDNRWAMQQEQGKKQEWNTQNG